MHNDPQRSRIQVLVVGAGVVGLTAALALTEHGIAVRIIEREQAQPLRTFPIVLHAQSLRILEELGVARAIGWRAAFVERLVLCCEGREMAALNLGQGGEPSGRIGTVDQPILRQSLLNMLSRRGVHVEYGTQLTALRPGDHRVHVHVWRRDREHAILFPGQPGKGEKRTIDADYVIGADGYDSTVRSLLGLSLVAQGPLRAFAFFVAATSGDHRSAMLELGGSVNSSSFPLAGGRTRFTFQVSSALDRGLNSQQLQRLLASSLPGYAGIIERCEFSSIAEFRSALVPHFGAGRVWLAGDAAHTAPPMGVLSLNAGVDEASELAASIAVALRTRSGSDLDGGYGAHRLEVWRQLLAEEPLGSSATLPLWLRELQPRLASSLPASTEDRGELLEQLSAL